MTVVACQCGSRFDAADHLAGKQVPCPACGRKLQIPSQRPAGIVVQCQCGRQFLANSSLAGKQVACPACRRPLIVPAQSTVSKTATVALENTLLGPQLDPFSGSPSSPFLSQSFALRPTAPTKAPSTKTIVIIAIVVLGLLGTGLVATVVWRKASELVAGGPEFANIPSSQQAIQNAESQGEPMTPAALEAYYRLPAGARDTTSLWISAGNLVATDQFQEDLRRIRWLSESGEIQIPLPGATWNEHAAARQLLETYQESLQKAHSAAEQGGAARYPTKFADGLRMLMPEAQTANYLSRLLIVEANVRAHAGDAAGVANSLKVNLSLAQSLDNYPGVVPGLVRIAIAGRAESELLRLMPYVDFSEADLQSLGTEIDRLRNANSFYVAMLGERAVYLAAFADPKQAVRDLEEYYAADSEMDSKEQAAFEDGVAATSGEADKAYFLHLMSGAVATAREPFPQLLESARKVEEEFDRFKKSGKWVTVRRPLSLLMFPAFPTTVMAYGRAEANHRITQTAIALHQYQRETGSFPQSLQALVPKYLGEVPSDPFDGQPLKFRQSDNQLILFSVGNDRKDDGGTGDESQRPDIVRRIPIVATSERQQKFAALRGRATLSEQVESSPGVNLLSTLAGLWDHSSFKGTWTHSNGVLSSAQDQIAAWKDFSATIPQSYRLIADLELLEGEGSFNLAFAVGGQPVMLVLDGWDGEHSGLNLVNGQTGNDNATTHTGRVLRTGMKNLVIIDVRLNKVDVVVNEQQIISWSGDPKVLGLDRRFWPAWNGKIFVGSWRTAFRLSRLELRAAQSD